MDAKGLLNAMIAELVMNGNYCIQNEADAHNRAGQFDMVVHAAMVVHGTSPTVAREWLAEEVQERRCAIA